MPKNSKKKKKFDDWNKQKKDLHFEKQRPGFHEREIWFAAAGKNVGFEQDGGESAFLRPVVITKKFNNEVFWGVPLTHTEKESRYYFHFSFEPGETSVAILSQIRLMDAKRLHYKAGYMDKKDFKELKKRLRALLK